MASSSSFFSSSSSSSSSSNLVVIRVCLILFLFVSVAKCSISKHISNRDFNVMSYGAVADGKTDNSKAFGRAWNEACSWKGGAARFYVPTGTYLVGPTTFEGPCRSKILFEMRGWMKAPTDLGKFAHSMDSWIKFKYIEGLNIGGGGTFDGQGASAWPYNQCSKSSYCRILPVSIRFDFVSNALVRGIRSLNSKNFHINVFACTHVKFQALTITAPGDSPNTDGIHIGSSSDITIYRSNIGTGDDCISLGPGSSNIYISKVFCGPGHGISVGSLGEYGGEEDVMGLTVKNCTLTDTTNGLRIKTWAPSFSSIAKNFTFEGIYMNNVANPIIIDQQYCPHLSCKHESPSRVQIRDVSFKDIWGTSKSKIAVDLSCSKGTPCRNIRLNGIYLPYHGRGGSATSVCSNVDGQYTGKQLIPPPCL